MHRHCVTVIGIFDSAENLAFMATTVISGKGEGNCACSWKRHTLWKLCKEDQMKTVFSKGPTLLPAGHASFLLRY